MTSRDTCQVGTWSAAADALPPVGAVEGAHGGEEAKIPRGYVLLSSVVSAAILNDYYYYYYLRTFPRWRRGHLSMFVTDVSE
jgi:hypothetical protein